MKRIFATLTILSMLSAGCANVNPINNPKIDNSNGKIDEIKNNQNGVMAEIGKLKQNAEIQDSELKEIQNGLLNINAAVSRNENSGIQILQGDGALIMVFSIIVIAMLLYRNKAIKQEKVANLISKEVAQFNDPVLNDNILKSAMKDSSEVHVYNLLRKYI